MSWTLTDDVPAYSHPPPQSIQKATYSLLPAEHRSPEYPLDSLTVRAASSVSVTRFSPTQSSAS